MEGLDSALYVSFSTSTSWRNQLAPAQRRLYCLLLVTMGNPLVIGTVVYRDRVPHHAGGNRIS